MTRRPLRTTRLAVALQAAGLLAVAAGVFAILISDMARREAKDGRSRSAVQGEVNSAGGLRPLPLADPPYGQPPRPA